MRYPATEKLEIIRLIEQSPLPARADPGNAWHSASDLLPMVRSVQSRRAGGIEGHVWRMKDRKAIEFREYQGDEQREDQFWA
jgi:hypothetical protein